jgi:AraC family transcriptional activator of tynA and feaB
MIVQLASLAPEDITALFVELELRDARRAHGTFTTAQLGELGLVRSSTAGAPFGVHRLDKHVRDATREPYYVVLPASGSFAIRHGGRTSVIAPGELCVIDCAVESRLEMAAELDAVWLAVPRATFEARLLPNRQLLGQRLPHRGVGHVIASAMTARVPARAAAVLASALIDLVATVVDDPAPPRRGRQLLARARDFIDAHLAESDLTPFKIARGLGIGTRWLGEVFAAEGATVMRWLTARRLEACRRELEQTQRGARSITEIAFAHGFVDVSSFNRAFKARFHRTPGSYLR